MFQIVESQGPAYLAAFSWEIPVFALLAVAYLGYLVWANTRPSDPDLAAALDFERRQAATAKAIAGEDK